MYVAVKGGETAIAHSLDLVADKRRGDRSIAELSLEQIDQQLGLAVDRVMTEGPTTTVRSPHSPSSRRVAT
jgi:alpha-D-ribose 1-methylphosphonate 5-triphosphate synthase subunit PhnI